jgi:ribosome maturation protein Sdo1
VDRILAKISREGESSLTREERRTLQNASKQYQKRRQDADDG